MVQIKTSPTQKNWSKVSVSQAKYLGAIKHRMETGVTGTSRASVYCEGIYMMGALYKNFGFQKWK